MYFYQPVPSSIEKKLKYLYFWLWFWKYKAPDCTENLFYTMEKAEKLLSPISELLFGAFWNYCFCFTLWLGEPVFIFIEELDTDSMYNHVKLDFSGSCSVHTVTKYAFYPKWHNFQKNDKVQFRGFFSQLGVVKVWTLCSACFSQMFV